VLVLPLVVVRILVVVVVLVFRPKLMSKPGGRNGLGTSLPLPTSLVVVLFLGAEEVEVEKPKFTSKSGIWGSLGTSLPLPTLGFFFGPVTQVMISSYVDSSSSW